MHDDLKRNLTVKSLLKIDSIISERVLGRLRETLRYLILSCANFCNDQRRTKNPLNKLTSQLIIISILTRILYVFYYFTLFELKTNLFIKIAK
jgi:hypothetical protein